MASPVHFLKYLEQSSLSCPVHFFKYLEQGLFWLVLCTSLTLPCQSICSVLHFCLPGRNLGFLGRFTKMLTARRFQSKSLRFFACFFLIPWRMTQCQSNLILLAFLEAWINILSIFFRKMQSRIIHMHAATQ